MNLKDILAFTIVLACELFCFAIMGILAAIIGLFHLPGAIVNWAYKRCK